MKAIQIIASRRVATFTCHLVALAILVMLGGEFVSTTHAALLVYEPFNYPATNSLTGLNGGLGFASGWLAPAGVTGRGVVYDQTATNAVAGTQPTWDGKVNNLPT